MSNKMIIKNCPAFSNNFCGDDRKEYFCDEITDCKIKQVVEKCRKEVICDDCELQGTTKCDARMCTNFYLNDFAEEILQLFNIEEVE